MTEVRISAEREALIYGDGRGRAHILTAPTWSPRDMSYLERATLAARMRALADVIDPGTYEDFLERQRVIAGAESVTRA